MSSCPHGMPNPKTCYDCMEEGNLEPPKWKKVGFPFNAIYPGTCAAPACSVVITEVGDLIQRWDIDSGIGKSKYTHIDCNL